VSQKLHAAPTVVNAAPAKDAILLICPATSIWNPQQCRGFVPLDQPAFLETQNARYRGKE